MNHEEQLKASKLLRDLEGQEDAQDISEHDALNEFRAMYGAEAKGNWLRLKDKKQGKEQTTSCVFLDEKGQCGIYEARPLQCSTYPWWPALLVNKNAWEAEAVHIYDNLPFVF